MVSLIIPCYNSEKYIGRCLESVLEQTDKDIELILVNDGSTDNSSHIINEYRSKLEHELTKFVYLEQDNQGVGAACNNAFQITLFYQIAFWKIGSGWINIHHLVLSEQMDIM